MIEIVIRANVVGKLDESVMKCVIDSVSYECIYDEYAKVRDLTQDLSIEVHTRVHRATKTNWNT